MREKHDLNARAGRRAGGGPRWFGYTRVYANPDETDPQKRTILREEVNPAEADAIREAAVRVLEHGESVRSIIRDWTARGIGPVRGKQWYPTVWVDIMTSARLAGLREWQGQKYPAQWPAILDTDTHERLAKMFADPARRKHIVRAQAHLLPVSRRARNAGAACTTATTRGSPRGASGRMRTRASRDRTGAGAPRSRPGCWRST